MAQVEQDRNNRADTLLHPRELPAPTPTEAPGRTRPASRSGGVDSATEWRHWLTGGTVGLLVFETITGLTIYLLPFSLFNQFSVLAHTVLGVLMLAPVIWYFVRHWRARYRGNFNHYQFLGYFSAAAVIVLLFSGLILTWQALFGRRISPTWDQVHVVATFVLVAGLAAHLATLIWRKSNHAEARRRLRTAQKSCLGQSITWLLVPLGACVVLVFTYGEEMNDASFPPDYSFKYGADRPFAPSLARKDMSAVEEEMRRRIVRVLDPQQAKVFAENLKADPTKHVGIVTVAANLCDEMSLNDAQRTQIDAAIAEAGEAFRASGGIHPKHLSGSAGCGTSGCHSEILAEWEPSAHRYSSMDFVFQAVQVDMAKDLIPEATRYCAGCHDPIALFAGAKNVGNVTLSAEGADEGVSCLVCHSIVQNDVRGNADYTIRVPRRYIYELAEGPAAKLVSDFLIRAYPRQHVESYSRPLYKTAEACGACHKQFIDEELNSFGWVQGQNQYDSWRKSRWHAEGQPEGSIGCRECHMPLTASTDPAAGDVHDFNRSGGDGKHRNHRFLAANQFVPRHHALPGAEEHCALTVKWLRGEYEIPEIADRWVPGPVIRVSLVVPEEAHPGEQVKIQTVLVNNKTGHDFPTGPLDMIEGWVEVSVTDESGAVIYASARPDDRGYLVNPQIVFKAELIDRAGELIGRHELWRTVGARFKRALFPGFTDTTDFTFECPTMTADARRQAKLAEKHETEFRLPEEFNGSELKVTAIVWYCKFSAPFLDRLFGEEARVRSEVTDISRAEAVIKVRSERQASRDEQWPPNG